MATHRDFDTMLARVDGVLGTDVHCRQHGRLGWVRTSLVRAIIAEHVRSHVAHHGGYSIGGPMIVVVPATKVPLDTAREIGDTTPIGSTPDPQ